MDTRAFEEFYLTKTEDGLKFKIFHPELSGETVRVYTPSHLYGPRREPASLTRSYSVFPRNGYVDVSPTLQSAYFAYFNLKTKLLPTDTPSETYTPYGYARIPELGETADYIWRRYTDGRVDTTPCKVIAPKGDFSFKIETLSGWIGIVSRTDLLAKGETIVKPLFYGDVVRRLSDGKLFTVLFRHTYGWHGKDEDGALGILEYGNFEIALQLADYLPGHFLPDGRRIAQLDLSDTPDSTYIKLDDSSITTPLELLK